MGVGVGVEGDVEAEGGEEVEAEVARRRLLYAYAASTRRRSWRVGNAFYCWCLPMPCFACREGEVSIVHMTCSS